MLDEGMDYLLGPVMAGMCKYESLKDGTLTLLDIALMQDALMAKSENEHRAHRASERI